jgi:muramoyltetrapeptide carboxypeptidase
MFKEKILPAKLKKGDTVVVVAPSESLSMISQEIKKVAQERLESLGLKVKFSKYCEECDEFDSSSIKSRVADLHEAFLDPEVKAIIAAVGGFNSVQLLPHTDWNIIEQNPKIFIGYSDTTALQNAMFAKTGLVTYSGPSFTSFGMKKDFEYTLEYFMKALMNDEDFLVQPSEYWSDDRWYKDQENRTQEKNAGWQVIREGKARGTILGANLCTFNLLQGSEYFPTAQDIILFIEDDSESMLTHLDRDLQSVLYTAIAPHIRAIVIGRFQKASDVNLDLLSKALANKPELQNIPIVAGLDFGHTSPMITFPIGATAEIDLQVGGAEIKILQN